MRYTQKYCLVAFMEQVEVNAEFHMSDWPLHITLADVFAIDRQGTSIDQHLKEVIAKHSSIIVKAENEAVLGSTHVVLINKSAELLALHTDLVNVLESNGAALNTPQFTRDGFLPHCTIQKNGRLHPGDTLTVDTISFVDMFPNSDWQQRRIIRSFTLQA